MPILESKKGKIMREPFTKIVFDTQSVDGDKSVVTVEGNDNILEIDIPSGVLGQINDFYVSVEQLGNLYTDDPLDDLFCFQKNTELSVKGKGRQKKIKKISNIRVFDEYGEEASFKKAIDLLIAFDVQRKD
jgi:hypothetical protein